MVTRRRPTLRAILKALDAECVECHAKENLTINHRRPLALGGTNDPSNLEVLCESCHRRFHGIDRSKRQLR